jgi:HD-GYP domain-containing protein (c-di-GMP phosphodiesterase class II)
MKFSMNGMLFAMSSALDAVESEIFDVATFHSKRVACLSILLGAKMGYSGEALSDLAGAAVMHDNALTEYVAARRLLGNQTTASSIELGSHCEMGERNMCVLPFYDHIKGAVLYHHENADGSGPFRKTAAETPMYAQLIHLADQLDNSFHLNTMSPGKYASVLAWLEENRGTQFAPAVTDLFADAVPIEAAEKMEGTQVSSALSALLPVYTPDYDNETVVSISTVFARIVDFKSHFTSTHSLGIAEKAAEMGRYYGENEDICTRLFLAGALHDIGKMTISNAILEKPGKLTDEEFRIMMHHADASWDFLRNMKDLPDVVSWACMHHEKLDGSGYPLGKKAEELSKYDRLLCCLDIYQALTEDRPYKSGVSPEHSISIMRDMAEAGKIDGQITEDIARCFIRPEAEK